MSARGDPSDPVLIVDDEREIRSSVRKTLALEGINSVEECGDGTSAIALIRERAFSAVILDLMMPGVPGMDVLTRSLEERPETPVIVATGTGDVDTAVRCMRAGAFDYLTKPIDRTRLVATLRHALDGWEMAREVAALRDGMLSTELAHPEAFAGIVTRDAGLLAALKYVEAVAPTSLPVFITGETGVGKELIARAVHALSGRGGRFLPVNVAGLDDTLFSDALFGHAKGAFTGADTAREGMVARAEDGTLFLDEVGDLAPQSQVKLLRLLQEREYYPLGTDRSRPTNARFVFATNLDLVLATGEGRFRKDLLYRLKSHQVRVPPLRERPADLPVLLDHFLDKACAAVGKARPYVPRELVSLLKNYSFPGNIRELEGMVYDAVVRLSSGTISLESFRAAIGPVPDTLPSRPQGAAEARENIFASLRTLPTLDEAYRQLIEEALHRADGNQGIAGQQLGLSRTALNRRLSRLR